MTHDQFEDPLVSAPRPPRGPGRLVVGGVVGACALGVSLGYWARPVEPGAVAHAAAKAKPSIADRLALQIVVDETPAPIGRPLEVLPADVAEPDGLAPPPPVEPMVPRRPASGLVKVDAPVAAAPVRAAPALAPAIHEAPPPKAEPAPKPKPVIAKASKPRPETVVAKVRKPDPQVAKLAKAKADAAKAAKARKAAELAKLEKAKAKAQRLAKAEKTAKMAKAERAERAKAAKLAAAKARPEKAGKTTLAKAEPAKKVAKVQVKSKPQTKPKKALAVLRAPKPEARRPVRPKAVKVAAKPAPKAAPARKSPPVKKLIIPRGEGPMRVARADRCASPDPGEAAVCADQRLSARDRQLQAAYRSAEAAGVPASALRNQQARWLAARAAAAREAPWAVEDVYIARISELKDQMRDARDN